MGADFVCHMEEVLDVYAAPEDPRKPRICFDEMPYQMIAETRTPLPMEAGVPERYDYEYERKGTCNLFLFFNPFTGWRHLTVTAQRTKQDFAHAMKFLVDELCPDADLIEVVLDQLNTHTKAALYATFAPQEAHRIARKLKFVHTPKHGSWLNMAEIEFSVAARQCLDRWLPDHETVQSELEAWQADRNAQKIGIDWQFTTEKARQKLQRLYPSIS